MQQKKKKTSLLQLKDCNRVEAIDAVSTNNYPSYSEESIHVLVREVGIIQEKREKLSTVHPQKQKQLAHTARMHQKQFHCLFLSQPGNHGKIRQTKFLTTTNLLGISC